MNLDSTAAMPHHSPSSETRPRKRRKTVGFVGDPEGSLLFDNDKETRPESTADTVLETESVVETHRLSISHFVPIGSPNVPHFDVLWVGYFVVSLINIDPQKRGRRGCAYFDPTEETVYILEDTEDNNHFDLTTSSKSVVGSCSHSHFCLVLEQITPDIF